MNALRCHLVRIDGPRREIPDRGAPRTADQTSYLELLTHHAWKGASPWSSPGIWEGSPLRAVPNDALLP
eukprot:8095437-Pyramimonas_sp.AAC.1